MAINRVPFMFSIKFLNWTTFNYNPATMPQPGLDLYYFPNSVLKPGDFSDNYYPRGTTIPFPMNKKAYDVNDDLSLFRMRLYKGSPDVVAQPGNNQVGYGMSDFNGFTRVIQQWPAAASDGYFMSSISLKAINDNVNLYDLSDSELLNGYWADIDNTYPCLFTIPSSYDSKTEDYQDIEFENYGNNGDRSQYVSFTAAVLAPPYRFLKLNFKDSNYSKHARGKITVTVKIKALTGSAANASNASGLATSAKNYDSSVSSIFAAASAKASSAHADARAKTSVVYSSAAKAQRAISQSNASYNRSVTASANSAVKSIQASANTHKNSSGVSSAMHASIDYVKKTAKEKRSVSTYNAGVKITSVKSNANYSAASYNSSATFAASSADVVAKNSAGAAGYQTDKSVADLFDQMDGDVFKTMTLYNPSTDEHNLGAAPVVNPTNIFKLINWYNSTVYTSPDDLNDIPNNIWARNIVIKVTASGRGIKPYVAVATYSGMTGAPITMPIALESSDTQSVGERPKMHKMKSKRRLKKYKAPKRPKIKKQKTKNSNKKRKKSGSDNTVITTSDLAHATNMYRVYGLDNNPHAYATFNVQQIDYAKQTVTLGNSNLLNQRGL